MEPPQARGNLALIGHTGPVWAVAFSPDGKTIALRPASIKRSNLWNTPAPQAKSPFMVTKEQKTLTGHTGNTPLALLALKISFPAATTSKSSSGT